MKILLLGEYSNVHNTLAQGLRALGHSVTVASNGDFWKDYPRDISLNRAKNKFGGIALAAKIGAILPRLCGYDVIQLINPLFVELKAERNLSLYKFLRRHNGKIFLAAYGMDYYWVSTCRERKLLRYSDFNIGDTLRTNKDALRETADWVGTEKERLNRYIADDCDGIIAGLYEYFVCYKDHFAAKTVFIPFPIKMEQNRGAYETQTKRKVRIFIGINRTRSEYKGTDIMLDAAEAIAAKYPDRTQLTVAESVPFEQYKTMMDDADVILDQLYSYTPAMNALLAMSKGIVCVGGGEPEGYDILGEDELRPIVNVLPTCDSVYEALERVVLNPQLLQRLKAESIAYVARHHDYLKVAQAYERVYLAGDI